MEVSQKLLGLLFALAAVTGFALGGFYDLLRLLRMLAGESIRLPQGRTLPQRILLFFTDVVFMLVSTVSLILLLYYTNDGQLRGSAPLGMVCGYFVYRHTLGRLVLRLSETAVSCLKRLCRWGARIALMPLGWLLRLLAVLWKGSVGRLLLRFRRRRTERLLQHMKQEAAKGFPAEGEPSTHE